MLVNNKKTIGVLINKIDNYFQQIAYRVLKEKALEYGYNLAIFNSYINPTSDKAYDLMEEKILDFTPFDNLDGIVVVPESFNNNRIQNHLEELLVTRCKAPVVYIKRISEKFYSIGTNEQKAIRFMIRHFIYDHKFTRISFLGGIPGHPDAESRYQCFLEEMKSANLEILPNAVFHGDFWRTYIKQAAEHFVSDPDHIPQAIICANDYMAVALCDELKELGYRIPEDICVSGYDDTKVAREYNPSISTVSIDYEKITAKAMDVLHNLINGGKSEKIVYLEPTLKLRASCGCGDQEKKPADFDINLLNHSAALIDKQIQYNYFTVDMASSRSFEEMHNLLAQDLVHINGLQKFYLCLFGQEDDKNEVNFTSNPLKQCTLRFAFENHKDLGIQNVVFQSRDILPGVIKSNGVDFYYVTMLHNSEKCLGYTVATFDSNITFDVLFHSYNITLGITIDELYSRIRIRNLMNQIEVQSIIDPLTGIFNRRGFEIMVEKFWKATCDAKGKAVFIGIDLDRLKYINDNFGHPEGDYSICLIADAIKEAAAKTYAVAGRMGGDEFAAVIFNGDRKEEQVFEQTFYDYIAKANKSSGKKYVVDASLGNYITTLTPNVRYEECMCKSDKALYKVKQLRKLR